MMVVVVHHSHSKDDHFYFFAVSALLLNSYKADVAGKCHFCLRIAHYRVSQEGFRGNYISCNV